MNEKQTPLTREIKVINIGLERFADDLGAAGVAVVQMDWRPPAGGDRRLIELLDRLAEQN
jgi:FdrA protein